jgi:hypothetical protein
MSYKEQLAFLEELTNTVKVLEQQQQQQQQQVQERNSKVCTRKVQRKHVYTYIQYTYTSKMFSYALSHILCVSLVLVWIWFLDVHSWVGVIGV